MYVSSPQLTCESPLRLRPPRPFDGLLYPTVVVGCVCVFFLTLWAGTQTVARMWGYAPILGHPMSRPSPLYAPVLFSCSLIAALVACGATAVKQTRSWAVPTGFLALYCYALSAFPVYAPWQDWEERTTKNPDDMELQTFHALWMGLCVKVERGAIEFEQAIMIFERAREALIQQRCAQRQDQQQQNPL